MKNDEKPKSAFEWSHGKRRVKAPRVLGHDDGVKPLPAPESEDAAPMKDPKTGRFVPGNRAHRRRTLKRKQDGIATLNPARCQSWLRPHVMAGTTYALKLLSRVKHDEALLELAADVADAHTMYRALMSLAAQGDADALREARQWLREHRTALATLSGLAGESTGQVDDDDLYVEEK